MSRRFPPALSGAALGCSLVVAALPACGRESGPGGPVAPVASVVLTPPDTLLRPGDTLRFVARAYSGMGGVQRGLAVTWSTSNPSIITVSPSGLVTAVARGTAWVRATVEDERDSAAVQVWRGLASLTVLPLSATLLPGQTRQFSSALRDSAGDLAYSSRLAWRSTDTSTVQVDDRGIATGVWIGTASVVGGADGVEGAAAIEVLRPPNFLPLVPDSVFTVPTATFPVRDSIAAARGDTVASQGLTWRSSNVWVAAVNTAGLVTGRHVGSAVVFAVQDTLRGSAAVRVQQVSLADVQPGYLGHACALSTDSMIHCWGRNVYGVLGRWVPDSYPWPQRITGSPQVRALSSGEGFSCAVAVSGSAYCWGGGARYRLGNGDTQARSAPFPVAGGVAFVTVWSGHNHSCALTAAGEAYCWGANLYGYIGSGSSADAPVPQAVAGGLRFTSLGAGAYHTCGVTTDSLAYCWGRNDAGQLGTGDTAFKALAPVLVAGGLKWKAVTGGAGFSCGLTADGEAWCWGSGAEGELGNGANLGSRVPVPASGSLRFASIDAGGGEFNVHDFVCVLTPAGAAWCWGHGTEGQLGNGSNTNANVPTPVAGGRAFRSVASGSSYSCGVTTAGAAFCWGTNYFGELGSGSLAASNVPVRVAGQP